MLAVMVCSIDRQCCSACTQDESCMEDVCRVWRLHAHKAESNSVIYTLPNCESSIVTFGSRSSVSVSVSRVSAATLE